MHHTVYQQFVGRKLPAIEVFKNPNENRSSSKRPIRAPADSAAQPQTILDSQHLCDGVKDFLVQLRSWPAFVQQLYLKSPTTRELRYTLLGCLLRKSFDTHCQFLRHLISHKCESLQTNHEAELGHLVGTDSF